jgi:hypothetical protein
VRDGVAHRHDSLLCSAVKLAYVETTKEVGTKASEQGTAQEAILRAHGIPKNLHCAAMCPICGTIMRLEATYCCQRCERLVHVRCLHATGGLVLRHTLYSAQCLFCCPLGA